MFDVARLGRYGCWLALIWICSTTINHGEAAVQQKKFTSGGSYVVIEVLDDDLIHVETSAVGTGPAPGEAIYTSPMVLKTDYSGPTTFIDNGLSFETADLTVEVNATTLAITVRDKTRGNALLTTITPDDLDEAWKGLQIDPGTMQHVYGLGQQFKRPGQADGDWTTLGERTGEEFGNGFPGFEYAQVGNVQIPIMYAVGDHLNYAFFLDNVYKHDWTFTGPLWDIRMYGDQVRYYLCSGPDLPDLRSDYMELTGRPPVPPRKAFGLWVSEFGYDNWSQIHNLKSGLRNDHFPVDGFVLDLNWFGGVVLGDATKSRMGRLDWDESSSDGNSYFFPNAAAEIALLKSEHIELAVIEESYLANTTQTFQDMPAELTVFQRTQNACDPHHQSQAILTVEGFWGKGRMIDWSDPAAGAWIHNERRYPNLVDMGVHVHWTDLGEPENRDNRGCYEGVETVAGIRKNEHSDIHNLYNLLWNKSIWDGYVSKQGTANTLGHRNPRPFILTRSGSAGTQRFGAAMWSGDIASNAASLATHHNAQLHMSFSGIDYYGADVGGFRREELPYNDKQGSYRGYESELYTQWFANACWFDIPIRPHTDNEFVKVCPSYHTAPHLVGHKASNLANLRQRYELTPYYYSLAYEAHLEGKPIIPPLAFYYQNDPRVREVGHEKLIGRDLLVGIVAQHGEYERNIYLPEGEWVNYHTQEWLAGGDISAIPVYRDGILRLPVFARAGAILPLMPVDEETMDTFGVRTSGTPTELIVRAFASSTATNFTLYEDDGQTLAYDPQGRPRYHYRTTLLSQQQTLNGTQARLTVNIAPSVDIGGSGAFTGAVSDRANIVEAIVHDATATAVRLNGTPLMQFTSGAAFDAATSGWYAVGNNRILAKSQSLPVSQAKSFEFDLSPSASASTVQFVCHRGFTEPGESIYVVGNIPQLGNWDPTQAVKLSPNIYYEYIWNPPAHYNGPQLSPVWTEVISGLPPQTTFEWKFLRKQEDGTGSVEYEPGPHHQFTTGDNGYSGHAQGSF